MADAHGVLGALEPVILLLLLGVVAVVASRALRVGPIVGYLVLGLALRAGGIELVEESHLVHTLAELGVVFLLFDIGLHFSLTLLREQARDIFGFGALQVALGTLGLGALAFAAGLEPLTAAIVGATLALSSTAVVARLIAERHQQSCPVGRTATSILIFQDVAAIFLLIVANALGREGASVAGEIGLAVVKAAAAFAVSVALARLVVGPLFAMVARTRSEEVFTATALLVALAAGWATGAAGLSLTLGAFLGGMMIAETPYRPVLQSEIKPFRGLLLSFFFIAVGNSLDAAALLRAWPWVLAATAALVLVKTALNATASLVFRWSVPGSAQLGFLLAQGSEFAFVILGLGSVRERLGPEATDVLLAAVAVSLAATPAVADFGRRLAGRLRQRRAVLDDPELQRSQLTAPVLIVGMGTVGRTVADALTEFGIPYAALERDPERFAQANADGYVAVVGDSEDPRLWEPMELHERRVLVLTAPRLEASAALGPIAAERFPSLRRLAGVRDEDEHGKFSALGIEPVVAADGPVRGLALASAVLAALGIEPEAIARWTRAERARAGAGGEAAPLPDAA